MGKKQKRRKKTGERPVERNAGTGTGYRPSLTVIQSLIIFLCAVLLYSNTFDHDYAVDDTLVITSNKFTQKGFAGLKDIFTTDAFEGHFGERGKTLVAGGRYRPLSIATFAIEYGIFGGTNPSFSHVVNAVLYGLCGLIAFLVLLNLFPQNKQLFFSLPFVIALLYVAHPIHTEAVANIKGRDEIMGFGFSMLTLLAALLYVDRAKKQDTSSIIFIVVAVVSYFLALLSKEISITFLAVIPLTFFLFKKPEIKHYAITLVPLVTVAGVFLLLRNTFTGSSLDKKTFEILNDPFVFSSFSERYGTVFLTYLKYFHLLIYPHPLTNDYYPYQIPVVGLGNIKVIFSIVLNVALVGIGLYGLFKRKWYSYGILFYFITFSVVSNFFFSVGNNMAERFMFMPSFGFVFLLGFGLYKLSELVASKMQGVKSLTIFAGFTLLIFVAYSAKTWTRNPAWKDDYTLFKTDIKVSTNSAKLNMAYGGELVTRAADIKNAEAKKEMVDEAIKYLEKAIDLYPDTIIALKSRKLSTNDMLRVNLNGRQELVRIENIKMQGTLQSPTTSESVVATKSDPALLLRIVRKAEHHLYDVTDQLIVRKSSWVLDNGTKVRVVGFANAWNLMGNAYYHQNKDFEKAEAAYQTAQICLTMHFDATQNLATIYVEQKRFEDAIPLLKALITTRPETKYYLQLGDCYVHTGALNLAISNYKKAYELNPKEKLPREKLGIAYGLQGDFQQATKFLESQANAHYMVGEFYGKELNDIQKAIMHLQKAVELAPDNVVYLEILGVAYGFAQQYDKAIKTFEAAVELDPNYAKAYYNLGITYRQLGDEATAQSYFDKAKELNPSMNF